jgi:hypothetical protein
MKTTTAVCRIKKQMKYLKKVVSNGRKNNVKK